MNTESSFWEKLNAISSALLVATAVGALFFAYRQISESREEAKIQHLVEVVGQFDEPLLLNSRRSLAVKRMDRREQRVRSLDVDQPPDEMYDLLNFFEHVSLLENRGYLDKSDVWQEFGYWMFNFYADARPLIDSEQKEDPASFSDFSKLMDDLKEIEHTENNGIADHPSPEDIYSFYLGESNVQPGAHEHQHSQKRK